MKITTRHVLQHFLAEHLKQPTPRRVDGINPFFNGFFLKKELIEIMEWLFEAKDLKSMNIENSSKEELLDLINDDSHILKYHLELWNTEMETNKSTTEKAVWNTLNQLRLPMHYLAFKDIADWDEYDSSNYTSLSLKAGRVQRVFGLYDINVQPQDVESVDSPPRRFYETREEAQMALDESGHTEEDTHILPLLIGNA